MSYNVGSLFAGVGGICLGFRRASENYRLIFANEIDEDACITYSTNFNHNLIKGDIEKILNPNLLNVEKNFLVNRLSELNELYKFNLRNEHFEFEEEIVEDCIKKLNTPVFTNVLMKNDFDLTKNIYTKIKKFNYDLEKFKSYIEYRIILIKLAMEYDNLFLENEIQTYKHKREEILSQKVDILTAGFPCQAFSIAGERKGFLDHRGELFYSVINLVKQLEEKGHGKPRVLFLENVKNLVSHDDGNTFKVIKSEIEKLGYILKYKVLNTYKYTDLPQNRERIFIICFLNKEDAEAFGSLEDLKEKSRSRVRLLEALRDTLDYSITKRSDPDLYYTKKKYPKYFVKGEINLAEEITEMYEIYQLRRGMYVRKNQSGVCPTLTANMGTGGHNVPLIKVNDGIRKLSPKDCFNLQGFRVGEEYILPTISKSSLYKQAGNAVSVDVVKLIANKIINALTTVDSKHNKINETTEEHSINCNSNSKKEYKIRHRINYFKTKKYGYFIKRIFKDYTIKKSVLSESKKNCDEKSKLYKTLEEIQIILNNGFSEEETNNLRKTIMTKLVETL